MSKIYNKHEIAILMGTYNGARYIKEQIDSIVNQTMTKWTLYIQDDGSTDSTLDIVNNYNEPRIITIDNGLTHQGICNNFMTLLNVVESKYYMFCDQDDVWLPNKIELLLNEMKKNESKRKNNCPILVYSDKTRVDNKLNTIIEREFARSGIEDKKLIKILKKRNTLDMILLRATAAGCTMLFNNEVKKYCFPYYNLRYHDSIIALATAKNNGIISTILESTMLYRIHPNNTVGNHGDIISIKERIKKPQRIVKANINSYRLWKIYGGGSFFRFLKAKIELFRTRYV